MNPETYRQHLSSGIARYGRTFLAPDQEVRGMFDRSNSQLTILADVPLGTPLIDPQQGLTYIVADQHHDYPAKVLHLVELNHSCTIMRGSAVLYDNLLCSVTKQTAITSIALPRSVEVRDFDRITVQDQTFQVRDTSRLHGPGILLCKCILYQPEQISPL